MKKLKKFFGVFAVALLLMSMSSSTTIAKEELKKETCQEMASIHANNWCCAALGEDYTTEQYYEAYNYLVQGCN